jgi:hypothetical protein
MNLAERQSGTSPFGALIYCAHGLLHFKNPSIRETIRTWGLRSLAIRLSFVHIARSRLVSATIKLSGVKLC